MSSKKKKDGRKKVMSEILKKLKKKDKKKIFHFPVTGVDQYEEYIKEPMDFSTIETKLSSYASLVAFRRDCDLIWSNCETFNDDDTIFYKAAQELKRYCEYLCTQAQADEAIDEPPAPVKASRKRQSRDDREDSRTAAPAHSQTDNKRQDDHLTQAMLQQRATQLQPAPKKRKYVKSGLYRKSREVRTMKGAGVVNDFAMGSQPTIADLLTVWDREQELQILTGKHSNERTQETVARARIGPLDFKNLRPHTQYYKFLRRYPEQLKLFHKEMGPTAQRLMQKKLDAFDSGATGGGEMYQPPQQVMDELKGLKPTFVDGSPFGIPLQDLKALSQFLQSRTDLCCADENLPSAATYANRLEQWVSTLTAKSNTVDSSQPPPRP